MSKQKTKNKIDYEWRRYKLQNAIHPTIVERLNPAYGINHCMTLTKCEKCKELYEADREHICELENSYPEDGFRIYEDSVKDGR